MNSTGTRTRPPTLRPPLTPGLKRQFLAALTAERSSGNRNLDREVLKAAKRWSFTAATENGRKVASLVRVPFEFVPPC